jgi:ribonuclease HI
MQDTSDKLRAVTLTTDGAARGNPGPGGWAALLQHDAKEKLLVGEEPGATTNNAMELMAAIGGLEALRHPCRVTLRADSTYVIEGLRRLIDGSAPPQKNRTLWERLAAAARQHTIAFEWVKGHSGDPRNERVNAEANEAAKRAYAISEARQATPRSADEWTLAICSPTGQRPVQWALITPLDGRRGARPVANVSQPTAVYMALVDGLKAARELASGARPALAIVSNYELIVKQGRGEWKVKQPAQQDLAAQAVRLRGELGAVRFDFAPTPAVLELIATLDD